MGYVKKKKLFYVACLKLVTQTCGTELSIWHFPYVSKKIFEKVSVSLKEDLS